MDTTDKIEHLVTSTLPSSTKKALDILAGQEWLKKSRWYLAGGTALAMNAEHRRSVDLDFFTSQSSFSHGKLLAHLEPLGWTTDIMREGTMYGRLSGAKVSFIAYPFFRRGRGRWYGAVRVLTPDDIAVMKIIAISQRGRKRDFLDLYWHVMHVEPLSDVLRRLPEQYPTVAHDFHHILKSLLYFEDAEPDPMPTIYFKTSWKTIKAFFRKEVTEIANEILL